MPQFVILRHTLPAGSERADHFDLMLEHDGQLLTWALVELPSTAQQIAEELPLHRRDYLTYEGPVSNNRGEVARVVEGTFSWLQRGETEWIATLQSVQLHGQLHLQRQEGKRWLVWFTAEQ
jgi:hypothetical protein